jgi:uncharacterized membrane protein YciS (DUF1049 family)
MSEPRAYHALIACFYVTIPIGLYAFVGIFARNWLAAFFAGVLTSIYSPSIALDPMIANDIGSLWFPRRYQALTFYGEGPHIAGMAMLFVALICLHMALQTKHRGWIVAACFSVASVPLSNWLAGAALAIFIGCYLLAREDLFQWRNWALSIAIGVTAYMIACPWLPPSNIITVRRNAPYVGGTYVPSMKVPLVFLVILLGMVGLLYLFRRFAVPPILRFATLVTLILGTINSLAVQFGFALVPQPKRYHLELEFAIVILLGFLIAWIVQRAKANRFALVATLVVLIPLIYWQGKTTRRYARNHVKPGNVEERIEYKVARWLDQNTNGERVPVQGSLSL